MALLHDRHLTVLATSALATVLLPHLAPGTNLVRLAFPAPGEERRASRRLQAQIVALLGAALDEHGEDADFLDLIGELASRSSVFAALWAAGAAVALPIRLVVRPEAGCRLVLVAQRLLVPDSGGDAVVVWRPSDERSARALDRLAAAG